VLVYTASAGDSSGFFDPNELVAFPRRRWCWIPPSSCSIRPVRINFIEKTRTEVCESALRKRASSAFIQGVTLASSLQAMRMITASEVSLATLGRQTRHYRPQENSAMKPVSHSKLYSYRNAMNQDFKLKSIASTTAIKELRTGFNLLFYPW
jgi:hypothetical protein